MRVDKNRNGEIYFELEPHGTRLSAKHEKLEGAPANKPGLERQVLRLISSLSGHQRRQPECCEEEHKTNLLWKNLAKVATDIESPNKFWSHVG